MDGSGGAGGSPLSVLRAVLAELAAARTSSLSDGALRSQVGDLGEVVAQVEALRLSRVRDLNARPDAVPGAAPGKGAATFLIHACRVSPLKAHFDVAVAEMIDPETGPLAELGRALLAGEVSREHVEVAVRAIPKHLLRAVDEDGVSGQQRVDAYLAEQSRVFPPSATKVLARHLLSVLDPDGSRRRDREAFERRSCRTCTDSTGMLNGAFQLDPEGGATVDAALAAFSAPRPVASTRGLGGEVVEVHDTRGKGQRQADALVTISQLALAHLQAGARGGAAPDHVGRVAAHVLVTATAEQLSGLPGPSGLTTSGLTTSGLATSGLATSGLSGPVSASTLARLACDGVLQKVLMSASGAVLNLGRAVRLATPAQRRAVTARDQTCVIGGCTVPVSMCDLHHIRSWAHGGLTDLANLAPLCPRHHSGVHAGIWALEVHDGLPWAVPPSWVDPQRRPVRNLPTDATQEALQLGQRLVQAESGPSGVPQSGVPQSGVVRQSGVRQSGVRQSGVPRSGVRQSGVRQASPGSPAEGPAQNRPAPTRRVRPRPAEPARPARGRRTRKAPALRPRPRRQTAAPTGSPRRHTAATHRPAAVTHRLTRATRQLTRWGSRHLNRTSINRTGQAPAASRRGPHRGGDDPDPPPGPSPASS